MVSIIKDGHFFVIFLSVFILIHPLSCDAQVLKSCGFDAIYQFGDSISDTGNAGVEFPFLPYDKLPYGITINKPTGRPSDGLIIIDYIAQAAGLPLLEPYENPKSNLAHGADFAVAGVTAVPAETLVKWHIPPFITNHSLTVQLGWFEKRLSTICSDPKACQGILKSALFVVGTIGFNDYNLALRSNKNIEEIKNTMVPVVVQTIADVARKLIGHGATRMIIPGIFQMGCSPLILTTYGNNTSAVFDAHGCLKNFNDMFVYHNDHLKIAIEGLRKEFPNVHIAYADIYSALQWIMDNLSNLGYKELSKACCGIGGKYNYDLDQMKRGCGVPGVPYCSNPGQHIFWDLGHFTHHTAGLLSDRLVRDVFPQLQCST